MHVYSFLLPYIFIEILLGEKINSNISLIKLEPLAITDTATTTVSSSYKFYNPDNIEYLMNLAFN